MLLSCLRCRAGMMSDFEDAVCPVCANRAYLVVRRRTQPREYLTARQVGEIVGLHPDTLKRWCARGLIRGATMKTVGDRDTWAVPAVGVLQPELKP